MKKYVFLLLLLIPILSACSPQKKLSNLLEKHPELITDSVLVNVIVKDTTVIQHSYEDTLITNPCDEDVTIPTVIGSVLADGAKATLIKLPKKQMLLVAEQLPGLIVKEIPKQIAVPKIIVNYEPKLNTFQKYLVFMGALFNIIILLIIGLFIYSLVKK